MAMTHRFLLLLGTAGLGALAGLSASPLAAQGRAVVQPLPPAASAELNRALRRLDSNPRDVDALILAGKASLELGDIDAAIGFFGRAEELSPDNARVKAGTAAAYVRVQRPVEALRLFEEAERARVSPASVAGDKGLAHDLVGNNREAQLAYRRSISYEENAEIRRRMALSYAIAGDREAFESTLLPLLEQRDFGAYRTRSFGLAILGQPDEAVAIADAVMPKDMAERVEPYLRYMRRLTPAQQAAAANLGIFPRAAAIGRDDPRIVAAREAGSAPALAGVDTGLAPSGRPLGQSGAQQGAAAANSQNPDEDGNDTRLTRAQRQALLAQRRQRGRLPSRADRQVRVAQPVAGQPAQAPVAVAEAPAAATPTPAPAPAPTPAPTPVSTPAQASASSAQRGELPALAQAELPPVGQPAATTPSQPARVPEAAPVQLAQAAATPPAAQSTAPVTPTREDNLPQAIAEVDVAPSQAASASAPVTVASLQTATPAPGFDLGQIPAEAETSPAATQIAAETPAPQPAASVSDAFADLMALPSTAEIAPAPDAVDITAIEIPREEEAEPEAAAPEPEPARPVHASRIWVQIATGRDRSALRFDWRRFSREAPDVLADKGPFVASWGETNRLLAGPFETRAAANTAVNALAEQGIGSFRFTSAAGQEIDRLD